MTIDKNAKNTCVSDVSSKRRAGTKTEKAFLGREEDMLVCWEIRSHASHKRRVSGRSELPERDRLSIKMGTFLLPLTIRTW